MPYRLNPTSHQARAILLNRAIKTAADDLAAGDAYVPQAWIDAATPFLTTYQPKVDVIAEQTGARSREISERDEAITRLAMFVRHGWSALKNRVERLNEPASVLMLYGLPADGLLPRNVSPDEWLNYGRLFVRGDTKAVAQGYAAMMNPSAAEVKVELDKASAEVDDVSGADSKVDKAQAAAAGDTARADELIGDLVDTLDFATRKLDGPSQRRIMRRYGIKFAYRPGETPEPDQTSAESTPVAQSA